MQVVIDVLWAASFILLGWSANYVWRATKVRTRFLIPYREYIRDDPDTYEEMINRLRIDNHNLRLQLGLLKGKIEQLEARLAAMRQRRKAQ